MVLKRSWLSRASTASLAVVMQMNQAISNSPCNALPPELILSIFLSLHEVWKCQEILPFQVTLSHVCQYWRQIALSMPQLWSSITLFSEDSLPCVEEWLRRSCSSPLCVRLDLLECDLKEEFPPCWYGEALKPIASNVHRFHTLLIFTFRETTVYRIFKLFEHLEAPLLENIFVGNATKDRRKYMTPFSLAKSHFSPSSTFKGGLPKLVFAELQPLGCIPPLTTITTLHISGLGCSFNLSPERLVEILRQPHQLITLSIEGNLRRWPVGDGYPQVYLPHLLNLELSSPDDSSFQILILLSTPKVESLRWGVPDWVGYCYRFDSFKHLLPADSEVLKFPALKYLTLVDIAFDPWHLKTLMEMFFSPTHVLFQRPEYSATSARQFLERLDEYNWGWKNAEVLAVKEVDSEDLEGMNNGFAWSMAGLLEVCPRIRRVMVDAEIWEHLKANDVDVEGRVEFVEFEHNGFPDYWWNTRYDWKDTPDFYGLSRNETAI